MEALKFVQNNYHTLLDLQTCMLQYMLELSVSECYVVLSGTIVTIDNF